MTTLFGQVPALEHNQIGHPEHAGRIQAIMSLLHQKHVLVDLKQIEGQPATITQLARAHNRHLVERVQQACAADVGRMDVDTYVTGASYELARLAAGMTCTAVDQILSARADNGFVLVRPPGHHAEIEKVGGFCLFNNIAVAARQAQAAHGLKRIMIVDYDVHHGNGTQDIFYDDDSVLFVSLHLYKRFFYPGSGASNELGFGQGRGFNVNVPFPAGIGDQGYGQTFAELIKKKAAAFQPEIILVSAGFDAHWVDPLASAILSLTGYAELSRMLIQLAETLCQGRILFVLEGGYHLDALAYGVLNVLYALQGQDKIDDPLGPAPVNERSVEPLLTRLKELHLLY